MIPIDRTIERTVKFKSVARGFPDREWVLAFTPDGLRVRRKGESDGWRMDWYKTIGFMIVHGQRFNNGGQAPRSQP